MKEKTAPFPLQSKFQNYHISLHSYHIWSSLNIVSKSVEKSTGALGKINTLEHNLHDIMHVSFCVHFTFHVHWCRHCHEAIEKSFFYFKKLVQASCWTLLSVLWPSPTSSLLAVSMDSFCVCEIVIMYAFCLAFCFKHCFWDSSYVSVVFFKWN